MDVHVVAWSVCDRPVVTISIFPIAPPVGALSAYLSRLISGRTYMSLREIGKQIAKRMPKILAMMSVLLLCGHWLDLYLLIMPAVWSVPRIGVFEIFITTGCLALLYLIFIHGLAKAPLVPLNDPVLAYEKLHTQHQDCME